MADVNWLDGMTNQMLAQSDLVTTKNNCELTMLHVMECRPFCSKPFFKTTRPVVKTLPPPTPKKSWEAAAAHLTVNFQSDWKGLNLNLATSKFHEILG